MLNAASGTRRPISSEARHESLHLDVCLHFGQPNVDPTYEHLFAHRTDVPPKVARHGMKQVHVGEPDNYLVCLQWPESQTPNLVA